MNDNNGVNNGYHDERGRFAKNNPGKRPGSSKNKLRDEIKTFLNENWTSFPEWFAALKPKEKIEVMLDLMPYCVSRLQSVSVTDEEGNQVEDKHDLTQWSEEDLKLLINLHTKYGIES